MAWDFPGPSPAKGHGERKDPMNATVAILLLGTGALIAAGLAVLTLVITAIHSEERRVRMSEQPSTYAEAFARKLMGVHVSRPEALCILAAPRADIAAKRPPAAPPPRPESATLRPAAAGHLR
jgi:hypothetical protein